MSILLFSSAFVPKNVCAPENLFGQENRSTIPADESFGLSLSCSSSLAGSLELEGVYLEGWLPFGSVDSFDGNDDSDDDSLCCQTSEQCWLSLDNPAEINRNVRKELRSQKLVAREFLCVQQALEEVVLEADRIFSCMQRELQQPKVVLFGDLLERLDKMSSNLDSLNKMKQDVVLVLDDREKAQDYLRRVLEVNAASLGDSLCDLEGGRLAANALLTDIKTSLQKVRQSLVSLS
jgi:hypothetical protein